ncbi:MAG: hypothetical protein JW712_11395 [Dehalococcoidales bacterium]|nr:hypothetical protein [Dehalococcoidales bacterium]
MLIIAGVLPYKNFPLVYGKVERDGDFLSLSGKRFHRTQGTGAMIGAALAVTEYLGIEGPHAVLAGDTGQGKGSKEVYDYLTDTIKELSPDVLALHYWLPNMAHTRSLCNAIDNSGIKPLLIADAASMYSAKAAGMAEKFDIFTPDATEMAFLADPNATHPAYISRHLFDTDVSKTPELVDAAYKNRDAAKLLVVKGKIDYVVQEGKIVATTSEPDVPELEAIGGTGDTITGMVTAFVHAGLEPHEAGIIATRANRTAGKVAGVTPATRVAAIIDILPDIFRDNLCEWSGVCYTKGEQ